MFDHKGVFSDKQAITVSAASENVINTGVASSDLGQGSPLIIRFIVTTAFASNTSAATLVIALQHSATNFGGTVVLAQSRAYAVSELTKGAYLPEIKIPDQHLQYLRLYYTQASEAFTAGNLLAWIDIDSGSGPR